MRSLGFGFERIGLIPLRAPRTAVAIAVLVTLVCGFGLTRLTSDHSISGLFRSHSHEFAAYERLKSAFPATERDVLLLVAGESLLSPAHLPVLQGLLAELQLADGVADVISIFSVPKRIEPGGVRFLIPNDIGSEAESARVLAEAREHPLVKERLLTTAGDGRQTLLTVVNLAADTAREDALARTLAGLRELTRDALEGSGLTATILGAPVMAAAIREAGAHDRLVFNIAGFSLVTFICILFFRRTTLVLIVVTCPALAIVWSLGVIGLLGFKMSPFMNTIAPLVLVVTFTNAMHMVFAIHHYLSDGLSLKDSIARMVTTIGSACVMTSLTTAIALLSLTIVDSDIIRNFGLGTAIASMVALTAVTFMVPLHAILLLGRWPPVPLRKGGVVDRMETTCDRLYKAIARVPRLITVAGIVLLLVTGALYFRLVPQFRLSDQVPDRLRPLIEKTVKENNLPLTSPIAVIVDAGSAARLFSDDTLAAVREIHDNLARTKPVQSVWSAALLSQFAAQQAAQSGEPGPSIKDIIEELPQQLADRFVNTETNKWLVTGFFPELDTSEMVGLVRAIEADVDAVEKAHPRLAIEVTGLATVASVQSHMLINQLQISLVLAVFVVLMVAALAFRSPSFALFSLLPNIMPVFAAGTVIYFGGQGLEYASVMALTVAFGLAVDDSIHFMNRYRIEREQGRSVPKAIEGALFRVGPVLAATSIILIAGLGVTLLSEMESTRVFGLLCIVTLAFALIADLVLLPATMLVGQKLLQNKLKF